MDCGRPNSSLRAEIYFKRNDFERVDEAKSKETISNMVTRVFAPGGPGLKPATVEDIGNVAEKVWPAT